MRELSNRLPDYYPGAAVGDTKQVQYAQHMDEMMSAWEAEGFPVDGSLPRTAGAVNDPAGQSIELPTAVVTRLSALELEHVQGRRRNVEAARQLFRRGRTHDG